MGIGSAWEKGPAACAGRRIGGRQRGRGRRTPLSRIAIASLIMLMALAPVWSQMARAQDANGDSPQIVPVTGDALAVVNGQQVDGGGQPAAAPSNIPAGVKTPVQDPGTGQWVDPNTGFVLDPNLGRWVDPTSGQPALTGWVVDPSTGQWMLGNDGNGVGQPGAATAAAPAPAVTDQSGQTDDTTAAPAPVAAQSSGPVQYVHDEARGIWIDPNTGQPPDPASVPYGIDPNTGLAVAADQTWDGGQFVSGSVWTAGPDVYPPSTGSAAAPWSPPRTVYIPTTGHSVDGLFLDVWRKWAGEQSWGDPITAEFQQDGNTLQYYDFGRFEYWPSDGSVRFGKIGELTHPFMIRRGLPGNGKAMADLGRASRAWLPLDPAVAPADSDDSQFVADTDHTVEGDFKQFWQATGDANYLGNPITEAYKQGDRTVQVFERGVVSESPGKAPALLPIGDLIVKRYGLDTTATPQGDLPDYSESLFQQPDQSTVGQTPDPNGERWVKISISQQFGWAMQGDTVVWQGYVSTGRPGFDTPTGEFHILSKLPVQTMNGVIGGEVYNVPQVPDVMYFTNEGHALHGTYWHHNFGTEMSHGCVNLPMDVADWMYQWAPVGTRVEIVP